MVNVANQIQKGITKWEENPDRQRYYMFIVLFILFLALLSPNFILREVENLSRTLLGLLGASTLFLFHEFIRLKILKLEEYVPSHQVSDQYFIVFVGFLDLLIAAPMIGFGEDSQIYTALLIRIVMLSASFWFLSRVYVMVAEYVRMSPDEVRELEDLETEPPIVKYTPLEFSDSTLESLRLHWIKITSIQFFLIAVPLYFISWFYKLYILEQIMATIFYFLTGDYHIHFKILIALLSILTTTIIVYPWAIDRINIVSNKIRILGDSIRH